MGQITLAEASPAALNADAGRRPGRYRVLLIKAGWGSSGYYDREVLERDGPKVWPAGTQQYLDHPSLREAEERPERSVKDWAGEIVTDPVWDEAEGGLVAEVEVFPQWRELLNPAFTEKVGLSIRAYGVAEHGEAEGREGPIVKSLTEGISVDWVTRAGAGGRVLELIESARATPLHEGKYTADQLKAMLAKGHAIKNADGEPSYPIGDEEDLKNAVRAVGRGGADHDKIRAYITRRAKALGKADLIPDGWGKSAAKDAGADDQAKPTANKAAREAADIPDRDELREAGATVGARLEARIHTAFTVMADDLYCDGRLTRDERITLSSAFGEALRTFVTRVEADAAQLYKRGPWSYPEEDQADEVAEALRIHLPDLTSEQVTALVSEAAKKLARPNPFAKSDKDKDAGDGAPKKAKPDDDGPDGDGPDEDDPDDDPDKDAEDSRAASRKRANTAPGTTPAPKKMKEGAMPEITAEQLAKLEEAANAASLLKEATDTIKAQGEKITALEARLIEADNRDRLRDNAARARTLCAEALTASGLPEQAHPRVTADVTRNLPTGEDGALDETKLGEAIKAAIHSEKSYLAALDEARGYGAPRGLGSDPTPADDTDDAFEKDLTEAFVAIGLDPEDAKTAAAGR